MENERLERIMDSVAAGQAATNSAVLDTSGFDSVTVFCALGAIVATGTVIMKIQGGAESDGGDMADLADTSVAATSDDDEGILAVELYRPREQYIRAVVTTATANGEIDGVFAVLRDPQAIPITQSSDIIAFELHASPAEGAA